METQKLPNEEQNEFVASVQATFQVLKNTIFSSDKIAQLPSSGVVDEDLNSFVDMLVKNIVSGPMQEDFGGEEILTAINNNKALAFSGAFIDMAEKSIDIAFKASNAIDNKVFKDFRDFFAISILAYLVENKASEKSLLGFIQNYSISDKRTMTFKSCLDDFFYTEQEDITGPSTLALFLHKTFEGEDKKTTVWNMPPHSDTIFRY
jgi:hypothetical protein